MYTVLAEIVAQTSGMHFTSFIKARLFAPLSMSSATYRPDPAKVATPSVSLEDGTYHELGLYTSESDPVDCDLNGPGGLFLSIQDATTYMTWLLQMLQPKLSPDAHQPARLVSDEQMQFIYSKHNQMHFFCGLPPTLVEALDTTFKPIGYGCAINMATYQGKRIYDHTGRMQGYASQMILAPEEGVAVMALVPARFRGNAVASHVALKAMEETLKLKQLDWEPIYKEGFWWTDAPPVPNTGYVESRTKEELLTFCGLYEAEKGNSAVIMHADSTNLPLIAQRILVDILRCTNLQPRKPGAEPVLYLCSPTFYHMEVCMTYYALIPLSPTRCLTELRTLSTVGNQVTSVAIVGVLATVKATVKFELLEDGQVKGFDFADGESDVVVKMSKK